MKPNKRNIRKWVKALRSGDYAQAQGSLAAINEEGDVAYCCLGVACEISGLVPPRIEAYAKIDTLIEDLHGYELYFGDESGILPVEVQKWLGLIGTENPKINGSYLSEYNDRDHEPFDKIADLIEAKYLTA